MENLEMKDPHLQSSDCPWKFDESVAKVFDKMLPLSIPGYAAMREFTTRIANTHLLSVERPRLLDVGASRGDAFWPILATVPNLEVFAVEESSAMADILQDSADEANARFSYRSVTVIRESAVHTYIPPNSFDCVLLVLTLMFVPVEDRPALLSKLMAALKPGGIMIVVEKTQPFIAQEADLFTRIYYDMKRDNGYSEDQIERKRLSLKGVLVPLSISANESLLASAGFLVTRYWQTLQFCGWLCKK